MAVEDPHYPVKIPVTFAGIYGATLCATIIALCLYGIVLLMVMQYFKSHSARDGWVTKGTILALISLSTLQSIFSSAQIYDMFVVKMGDLMKLDIIIPEVPGSWICEFLSAFIAEVFFCTRIWIVGTRMNAKARWFAVPAFILALVQICSGLAEGSAMATAGLYSHLTMRTDYLLKTTAVQGAAAALSDIIISGTLVYIFHSHRSGLARTNSMINKLMTYAINRAVATSFCAVMAVILYYFCSGTYYFMIPFYACTHLYVISAVSMLTARDGLREDADPSFHVTHLGMSTNSAAEDISNTDLSGQTAYGANAEKRTSHSSV